MNPDVAKQRAEAVRIGEEAIETWRAYSVIAPSAGVAAYDDIALGALADVAVDGSNTVFTLKRTVVPGPGWKSIQVVVAWVDRAGQAQSITLNSIIGRSDPALSGVLTVLPGDGLELPARRDPTMPYGTIPLAGAQGQERLSPTQVRRKQRCWVFDNVSGVITSVCAFPGNNVSLLVPADNCLDPPSWLITGFVRFSFGPFPNGGPAGRRADLPWACSPLPSAKRLPTAKCSSHRFRTRS